jgi:hypothetical protein
MPAAACHSLESCKNTRIPVRASGRLVRRGGSDDAGAVRPPEGEAVARFVGLLLALALVSRNKMRVQADDDD